MFRSNTPSTRPGAPGLTCLFPEITVAGKTARQKNTPVTAPKATAQQAFKFLRELRNEDPR